MTEEQCLGPSDGIKRKRITGWLAGHEIHLEIEDVLDKKKILKICWFDQNLMLFDHFWLIHTFFSIANQKWWISNFKVVVLINFVAIINHIKNLIQGQFRFILHLRDWINNNFILSISLQQMCIGGDRSNQLFLNSKLLIYKYLFCGFIPLVPSTETNSPTWAPNFELG